MRIVTVIDDWGSGGAQRQLVNVAVGLARRGHDVACFTYHADDHFRPALDATGIPVLCFPKRSRYSLAPVGDLRRVIRARRADAVLAFLETPAVYAEFAALGTGARLVIGERNAVPDDLVTASRRLKAHLHRLADAVVPNSHAHREWMARRFPFLEDRLETIWNGVDLDAFRPRGPRPADGTLRLLGIGRIAPAKNLSRAIDAIARARALGVPVTVDWAGRDDDLVEADRARRAVTDRGLDGSWRWLGEQKDVSSLFATYDALLAPSLWEGLPNAVCEALASGLPVLASNVSDNARLVAEGERGHTFSPLDPDAIVAAIRTFHATSAATRAAMGQRARRFAEERLGIDACVEAYERVLAHPEGRR